MKAATRQRFDAQLAERNKAYSAMAENLARAGHAAAADRVRALTLSREPEQPGTFIRALLGPDVAEDQLLMIQLSTDVIGVLRNSGAMTERGKVPVVGLAKACFAAASFFERMAKAHLVMDDGARVDDAMISEWRSEASALSELVERMMDAASPG